MIIETTIGFFISFISGLAANYCTNWIRHKVTSQRAFKIWRFFFYSIWLSGALWMGWYIYSESSVYDTILFETIIGFAISFIAGVAANYIPIAFQNSKERLSLSQGMSSEIYSTYKKYRIWNFCIYLIMFNFIIWSWGLMYLGGEAVFGHVENGVHFLHSSRGDIEVTKEIYQYSLIHTYSVIFLAPLSLHSVLKSNQYSLTLKMLLRQEK